MSAMAMDTDRETTRCDLAAQALADFGRLQIRAQGTSMLPAIWPGDVLSVEAVSLESVQPGDVILGRRNGLLVAHRAVRAHCEMGVVCRGDFLGYDDAALEPADLLGKVTTVLRAGSSVDFSGSSLARLAWQWVLQHSWMVCTVALKLHGWRMERRGMRSAAKRPSRVREVQV